MAGIDPRTGVLVCTVFRLGSIPGWFPVFELPIFLIGMVGVPLLLYYDLKSSDRWAGTAFRKANKADNWRATGTLIIVLVFVSIPFFGDLIAWGLYLFRGAHSLFAKTAAAF